MSLIRKAFKRLHYPIDIIAQCVRWYLAYSLSLRNLEEMMAERGIDVDHSTLHRWVIRLIPLVNKVFRRYKRPVGRCWRVDETYIKIKGQWKYLYRAVDKTGQTIDFLLTAKRDTATALRFFCKTIRHHDEPEIVTIDKSSANKAALDTLNMGKIPEGEAIEIRQNKYLNNLIKQDHRNIKRRIRTMPGFKSFRRAQTLLAGIEIVSMLRKGLKVVFLDLPTSYQFMNRTDEFTERMLAALNSMMLDMLAAVARKDYEDRHRRQVQGVQKAKEEGKYKGRPINKILHQKLKAF